MVNKKRKGKSNNSSPEGPEASNSHKHSKDQKKSKKKTDSTSKTSTIPSAIITNQKTPNHTSDSENGEDSEEENNKQSNVRYSKPTISNYKPLETNQPQANLNAINFQNLISNGAFLPLIQNYMASLQKNNQIQNSFSQVLKKNREPSPTYNSDSQLKADCNLLNRQTSGSMEKNHPTAKNDARELDLENKLITIKFLSKKSFETKFKNYFTLQNEIKRCKPLAKITSAYIDSKDQLILKVKTQEDAENIKQEWPNDAFKDGIDLIKKNPKYYIALLNVDQEIDLEEIETKTFLNDQFNITHTMRLVKKKTNQPLNIIKAIVSDETSYNKIISEGRIKIGYSIIKIKPWNFESQSDQCFKCLKFGHSFRNCRNEETCLRCSGKHNFKNCQVTEEKDLLCNNCKGNHAACSKSCPIIIKRIESKKNKTNLIIKPGENLNYRVNSLTTANKNNSESTTLSFIIEQKINTAVLNILKFLIDLVANFNSITSAIYEDPTELIKLIENTFGNKYSSQIQSKLDQYQDNHSDDNNESDSDDSNMQYE